MRNNEERLGAKQEKQDSVPFPVAAQEQQSLNLNFVVPTEFVDLPSKGKFYPPGHPLNGKDVIEIKQMTAKEEDILTSRSLLKKGVALDKLIQSLIVDKNINPESLTVEDRNAIVIKARISGYGPKYDTMVACPSCTVKSKYSFNLLEKLPTNEEEAEEEVCDVDSNGNFSFTLPVTKWNVVCRALSGTDEKTLLKVTEMKKKSLNDSILLDQLKLMIVSIQGVTDRATIENAIAVLPAGDSRFLRNEYQKFVKPLELKQNYVCGSCEYETEMEVPITADFFWFK